MNLYLISAPTKGYDVFSDAVVAARGGGNARLIHPNGRDNWYGDDNWDEETWTIPGFVTVKLIGRAAPGIKEGVICASFHAG